MCEICRRANCHWNWQITPTKTVRCRRRLWDVASSIGVSHKGVHMVLKQELHMSKVSPHLLPKVLTEEQKVEHVRIAQDCLHEEETDSILECTITRDESWVFEYDLVEKCARIVWLRSNELCIKKARCSKLKINVHFILFFDWQGVLLIDWVPEGEIVTGPYYVGILRKLQVRVHKKWPKLWKSTEWILHHDNAGPHRAFKVNLNSIPASKFQVCFQNWKKCVSDVLLREGITLKGITL